MPAEICNILEKFADDIEKAPVHLIGASISVSSGPGGGSATGLSISVTAGPAGTQTTGMRIAVDSGKYESDMRAIVADIREAAASARKTKPARSWIFGLIDRVKSLGNKALDSSITTAATEIAKYYV